MVEPTGVTVLRCPLDGCHWAHAEPVVNVPPEVLAGVFGAGVMTAAALHQHMRRVEDALRGHFEGHKIEDFLRTITRLQQQLAVAEQQVTDGSAPPPAVPAMHIQWNGGC